MKDKLHSEFLIDNLRKNPKHAIELFKSILEVGPPEERQLILKHLIQSHIKGTETEKSMQYAKRI